jgi:hypothetical protein
VADREQRHRAAQRPEFRVPQAGRLRRARVELTDHQPGPDELGFKQVLGPVDEPGRVGQGDVREKDQDGLELSAQTGSCYSSAPGPSWAPIRNCWKAPRNMRISPAHGTAVLMRYTAAAPRSPPASRTHRNLPRL